MKRIAGTPLIMLTIGLTAAGTNSLPDTNDKLNSSLVKEFAGAAFVKWGSLGEYQMASFILDGQNVYAYFNSDCELEGSVRYISFDQLPEKVMKTFDKRYSGSDFSDILKVTNTKGTSYCVTVTTRTKIYRVKASPGGNILSVIRKIK